MAESTIFPAIWNVPYRRNPFFTGREYALSHLYESLRADNTIALTQPQGISGLGGIGKTQTALEYAYRYSAEYRAVLWVRADSQGALISEFVRIAELLALPEKDEQDQNLIVEAVMHWLHTHSLWLLVLDNVEDLAITAPFIPMAGEGHTLLTTRAYAIGGIAQRVILEKMQPGEAELLLLRRANFISPGASLEDATSDDRTQAEEIALALDGLPLALDQAGAYIKEMACSLSDYLVLYASRRDSLLKERGSRNLDYPESVATTWSLSFEKVEQANPAAAELLSFCAFLYPDAIPEEIITQSAPGLGPLLQAVATNPIQLNASLKELLRFSLLHREADARTCTIHRLVQAVLKDKMDPSTKYQWAERSIRSVNRIFPVVIYDNWARCQQLLPHARVCEELIEQHSLSFPEAAQLLNQTGYYLHDRALYAAAEPLYQRALELREKILGPEHPETATTLRNLAQLYRNQGRYGQAELFHRRALAIREQVFGPEHPEFAAVLDNLAQLYQIRGQYAQAEPLYQRALAIREQVEGAEHPGTASALDNLAYFYRARGQYAQAEPLLRRALAIREKVRGPEHPELASILDNLAQLNHIQGKYEQAALYYQRALAIREKELGIEHPEVASILDNLAQLCRVQGRYSQAEPLFRRALAIREKAQGPEHPETASVLDDLAQLYYVQGQHGQAEPLYHRVLAIREKVLGTEHAETASILDNLAQLYKARGQYIKAEAYYQRALAIREKILGAEHLETASILNNLAQLYQVWGRYAPAEALYQRALAIYEEVLGPRHSSTKSVRKNYASVQRKIKRGG